MSKSLKTIAYVKAFRGCIALTVGIALIIAYQESMALAWVNHPQIQSFLEHEPVFENLMQWVAKFSGQQVLFLAILTLALGALRWTEAVGIWINKSWAQWLAVISGSIYIPFEINALATKFSLLMSLILVINLLIVIYLAYLLRRKAKNMVNY